MEVVVHADREGDSARLILAGPFDLPHAVTTAQEIANIEASLAGCRAVELDLAGVDDIDGAGAVQLARLVDRVEAKGSTTQVLDEHNPKAARLIALYRQRRTVTPPVVPRPYPILARFGSIAAQLPRTLASALDFVGHNAAAAGQALTASHTVNWRALPHLVQQVGADGLPVASGANLLVGLIIGFIGVSQLGRFGATVYVPELVVVAHFRELGPLVTAIVIAGRSGAGLASEIATMKVSEEIDALRAMGFDPVRWLVVPRCVALVLARSGAHLGRRRAGAPRRAGRDDQPHGHVDAGLRDGDGGRHHRDGPPGGTCQDPVPGAGDRSDRVRSGARHPGRCGRSRCANDDRSRPIDLRRHRDQRAVHHAVRR